MSWYSSLYPQFDLASHRQQYVLFEEEILPQYTKMTTKPVVIGFVNNYHCNLDALQIFFLLIVPELHPWLKSLPKHESSEHSD